MMSAGLARTPWRGSMYSSRPQTGRSRLKAVAAFQCPFRTLGVSASATETQIKQAYRKLALEWHPDVSKHEGSHAVFLQLTEAYDFLMSQLSQGRDGTGAAAGSSTDWEFHDWYWNFRISRTWAKQHSSESEQAPPQHQHHGSKASGGSRANISQQLAGLRQRAAVRSTKAKSASSSSSQQGAAAAVGDMTKAESCVLLEAAFSQADGMSPAAIAAAAAAMPTLQQVQDPLLVDPITPDAGSSSSFCQASTDIDGGQGQGRSHGSGQEQAAGWGQASSGHGHGHAHGHGQPAGGNTHHAQRRSFVAHSGTRDQVASQLAGLRRKASMARQL